MFTSAYEYIPQQKKSIVRSIGTGIFKLFGGVLGVFDWFPEVQEEITSHRYAFIKKSYLLSVLKADIDRIVWPNEKSKDLFNLVYEEMTYMLLSLNFNVLVKEYAHYNKKILMNRIKLWLNATKADNVKLVKFLPSLYKILKEEFFKADIYELR